MNDQRERATRICLAGGDELERFRTRIEQSGLTWGAPELVVFGDGGDNLTAEFKVEFYRDEVLVDIFEFFIYENGEGVVSEDEIRVWIRENLPSVLRRAES